MYREFKHLNLPAIDAEMLQFWEDEKIFEKSVDQRPTDRSFVFYEGPPSANGKPGIHHVMARTVKDVFCRYQTLKGFRVDRKGGWDTHGLPIELQVEKELGITKDDIGKKISVDDYNKECRSTVMRYKDLWDDITRKMGYWVDLDNPYITFHNEYIETCWWLLKRLYDKGLLYKGYTIQPYSPAAGTGLSSHELNMPGTYQDVTDTTIVAMFKVKNSPDAAVLFGSNDEDVRILAWTTTPWTLPSNTALTVGPNIQYVKIKTQNPYTKADVSVVLAEALVSKWFGGKNQPEIIEQSAPFSGQSMFGIRYEQLLPYVQPTDGDAFKVITGDFVTTEDGTGVVHTAPSFGADDMRVARQHGIGSLTLVDRQGKFLDEVGEFGGRYVKDYKNEPNYQPVDVDIAIKLKTEGYAFNVQKYVHPYPHCWRTDKPVLYYPLDSWFIKASAMKERMAELNKTINWKPESTGTGRFRQWLENLQDWNLSRSRYWGIPLPIWVGKKYDRFIDPSIEKQKEIQENFSEKVIIGSFGELQEKGFIVNIKQLTEDLQEPNSLIRTRIDANNELNPINIEDIPFSPNKFINYNQILDIPQQKNVTVENLASANFKYQILNECGYLRSLKSINITDIDLHRPYIDEITVIINFEEGDLFWREADLIDVWFDSGSMPYAQWGLDPEKIKNGDDRPFKTPFETSYPASFIAEGVDQTRGWFYTLHAIAVMCFDSVAFKNVVSNGLVLDKNGNKMSKSKGNVVDPFETIDEYGADATRWYLLANASPWDDLKFDLGGILETRNKFFGTLFNIYKFFAPYANLDRWTMDEQNVMPYSQRTELDRWIISKLYSVVAEYRAAMDDYEPTKAARAVETFVDEHLSNWYVRLARRRFWRGDLSDDKVAAYQTLFECLTVISQLSASLAPFFSDWLYRNLTAPIRAQAKQHNTPLRHDSIHLSDLTEPDSSKVDKDLETRMEYAQRICSLALSIRKKEKLRVRLPLQKILLPVLDEAFIQQVDGVKDLILSEINVKNIEYITDASGLLKKGAKANFKTLGAKLGKDMKAAADLIATFSNEDINALEKSGAHHVTINGNAYTLTPEDMIVSTEDLPGWKVASDGALTVALDVTMTDELLAEGTARDLVNRIQNLRKEKDFQVTDRIRVTLEKHAAIVDAVQQFGDYIKAEVLAESLTMSDSVGGEKIELNDEVALGIEVSLN